MKKLKLPNWLIWWFDDNDPVNFAEGVPGYGKFSKIGKKRALNEAVVFSLRMVALYYALKFMRCIKATQSNMYAFFVEQSHWAVETAAKRQGNFPDVVYRYYAEAEKHPWRLLLPVMAIYIKTVNVDEQIPFERFVGRQFPKPMYLRGLGK